MLKTLLEFAGHRVEIAGDGLEGAEMISTQQPDVVLVDIGLPGLNGYDLARRISLDQRCRDVFLVALTGYSLPADRQRAPVVRLPCASGETGGFRTTAPTARPYSRREREEAVD